MVTLVDSSAGVAAAQCMDDALLPVNPFTALQFHFGMLLGVDDLETGQAYARGKTRLHNAWLHRDGVVWGFKVGLNSRNELTVDPGLGLDAAGHELHLDRQACVDLGAWYAANQGDTGFSFESVEAGGKRFSAHVVARFKACLTRPVPAMLEPCAGAQTTSAFSRAFETVELLLRPGLAAAQDLGCHRGYQRLRQLFQLEADAPALADVAARRAQIQALPAVQQPAAWLLALREFAALDTIDLQPQAASQSRPASMFPQDPTELLLADVANILVKPDGAGGWTLSPPLPLPVVTVRRSHIATATIQELLCGPLFGGVAAAAASGPTVSQAEWVDQVISLATSRPLADKTVTPAAFSASDYSAAAGWAPLAIAAATLRDDGTLRIDLASVPAGTHLRLVASGTGATPLLAADDLAPLGAAAGAGADSGVDFVKMFTRS